MIYKPLTDRRWKGYTLDELQDQIMLNDVRIMVKKDAVRSAADNIKGKTGAVKTAGILSVVLSYIDYIKMGIGLVGKVKSIIAQFRHNKA